MIDSVITDNLIAKTKAFVISSSNDRHTQSDGSSVKRNSDFLPKAYSIQHLRNQAVDLLASKDALQDGATSDRLEASSCGIQIGSLLDVTSISKRCRQSEDINNDTLLVVHVEGDNSTQLGESTSFVKRLYRCHD